MMYPAKKSADLAQSRELSRAQGELQRLDLEIQGIFNHAVQAIFIDALTRLGNESAFSDGIFRDQNDRPCLIQTIYTKDLRLEKEQAAERVRDLRQTYAQDNLRVLFVYVVRGIDPDYHSVKKYDFDNLDTAKKFHSDLVADGDYSELELTAQQAKSRGRKLKAILKRDQSVIHSLGPIEIKTRFAELEPLLHLNFPHVCDRILPPGKMKIDFPDFDDQLPRIKDVRVIGRNTEEFLRFKTGIVNSKVAIREKKASHGNGENRSKLDFGAEHFVSHLLSSIYANPRDAVLRLRYQEGSLNYRQCDGMFLDSLLRPALIVETKLTKNNTETRKKIGKPMKKNLLIAQKLNPEVKGLAVKVDVFSRQPRMDLGTTLARDIYFSVEQGMRFENRIPSIIINLNDLLDYAERSDLFQGISRADFVF